MKLLLTLIALGLVVTFSAPAFAQSKAECEKLKDMKWDEKTKKCVKK